MQKMTNITINGKEYAITAIPGAGAPAQATEGAVGQFYMDTDNGDLYKCVAENDGVYTWEPVGGGGTADVLKGTISGEIIIADDVSPIPHNIKATVSGVADPTAVTVKRYGKNLLDYKAATGRNATQTVTIIDDGVVWKAGGNHCFIIPCDIPAGLRVTVGCDTVLPDGSGYYNYKNVASTDHEYIRQVCLRYADGTSSAWVYPFGFGNEYYITDIFTEKRVVAVYFYKHTPATALTADITVKNIQMVIGYGAAYTPHIEATTHIPNANGVIDNIQSISPDITLIANVPDVQMSMVYNRNLTDCIDKLETSEKLLSFSAKTMPFDFSHLRPFAINHRGYNSIAPENTLPAFRLSKQKGFDFVETDISFTSDGVPVLLHDDTINRTARNADGTEISESVKIGSITYEQALIYDFGIWKSAAYAGTKIPTFEQFLVLCKNLTLFPYIELKENCTKEQLSTLLLMLEKYGMLRSVTWISFHLSNLEKLVELCNASRVGFLSASPPNMQADMKRLAKLKGKGANVFVDFLWTKVNEAYQGETAVTLCAKNGMALETYGITSEADMAAADPIFSGFTTDIVNAKEVIYNANIGAEDTGII